LLSASHQSRGTLSFFPPLFALLPRQVTLIFPLEATVIDDGAPRMPYARVVFPLKTRGNSTSLTPPSTSPLHSGRCAHVSPPFSRGSLFALPRRYPPPFSVYTQHALYSCPCPFFRRKFSHAFDLTFPPEQSISRLLLQTGFPDLCSFLFF